MMDPSEGTIRVPEEIVEAVQALETDAMRIATCDPSDREQTERLYQALGWSRERLYRKIEKYVPKKTRTKFTHLRF